MIVVLYVRAIFFQETFPSSNVFVTWFELPMGPLTNTKEIPVDGYIKTLRIAVQPVTSKSDVALFYPNGIKFPHKFEQLYHYLKDYHTFFITILILGTVVSFEEKHEQRELSRDILTLLLKVNTFNSLRLCQVLRLLGFFPTEDIFNIKKIRFNTRKKIFFIIIDSVKIYSVFKRIQRRGNGDWQTMEQMLFQLMLLLKAHQTSPRVSQK